MLTGLILNILASKVMPVILPPLIAGARKFILEKLPPSIIPLALTLGGAAVNSIAGYLGVEGTQDLASLGADAWDGALLGLATVGVHQLGIRARDWFKAQKAKRAE
jgi:hypothetical protein